MIDINKKYLDNLKKRKKKKQRPFCNWYNFCEAVLEWGWAASINRSKSSPSIYLYINRGEKFYVIRFSNHRTQSKNYDFWIGRQDLGAAKEEEVLMIIKKES